MNPVLITLSLLALLPPQVQSPIASIQGTVTSESSGKAIANATVKLSHSSYVTRADTNGTYHLSDIAPYIYDVTFSAPCYIPLVFRELTIPPSTALGISVRLRDLNGEAGKSIAIEFSPGPWTRPSIKDKMSFYQPDSTIDYKIRIVNPDLQSAKRWTIKKK